MKITHRRIAVAGRHAGNVPSFVRWALRWLRGHHYVISQSDKDGVFVIMDEKELAGVKHDQCRKHFSTGIAEQQIEVERRHARQHAQSRLAPLGE